MNVHATKLILANNLYNRLHVLVSWVCIITKTFTRFECRAKAVALIGPPSGPCRNKDS